MKNLKFRTPKSEKLRKIKKAIKSGTYDLESAIKGAADRIVDYPQALGWK